MKKEKKKKKGASRIGKMFLLALLFGVFFFSSYQIYSIMNENKQSEDAYASLRDQAATDDGEEDSDDQGQEGQDQNIPNENQQNPEDQKSDGDEKSEKDKPSVDIKGLKKSYPELTGWIQSEGTRIDYPVMQADNNEFYLDHLYDGSSNANGSLFVDFRNAGILNDDNTVIYGHNMDNGAMFGKLSEYKSQDFYQKNPTMKITTEKGDYTIQLISGTVEDGDYQFVKLDFDDFEDMKAYTDKIRQRSTFESTVKLEPGDKLISLCTCSYESKNARYMLVGVCRK